MTENRTEDREQDRGHRTGRRTEDREQDRRHRTEDTGQRTEDGAPRHLKPSQANELHEADWRVRGQRSEVRDPLQRSHWEHWEGLNGAYVCV